MGGMSTSEWVGLLGFCTLMTFTPGPNTTLSTALAANRGLRAALRFCLAVPSGWLLLMTICSLGVGTLVLSVPALQWGIRLAGAAYLIWLASRLWQVSRLGEVDAARLQVGYRQGIALQFLNIKAWMLALTLIAGWGTPAGEPAQAEVTLRLVQLTLVMVVFAFASNGTYALVGALLRQWLAQGQRLLWFNRLLAAVLVLTAIWMLRV